MYYLKRLGMAGGLILMGVPFDFGQSLQLKYTLDQYPKTVCQIFFT